MTKQPLIPLISKWIVKFSAWWNVVILSQLQGPTGFMSKFLHRESKIQVDSPCLSCRSNHSEAFFFNSDTTARAWARIRRHSDTCTIVEGRMWFGYSAVCAFKLYIVYIFRLCRSYIISLYAPDFWALPSKESDLGRAPGQQVLQVIIIIACAQPGQWMFRTTPKHSTHHITYSDRKRWYQYHSKIYYLS